MEKFTNDEIVKATENLIKSQKHFNEMMAFIYKKVDKRQFKRLAKIGNNLLSLHYFLEHLFETKGENFNINGHPIYVEMQEIRNKEKLIPTIYSME